MTNNKSIFNPKINVFTSNISGVNTGFHANGTDMFNGRYLNADATTILSNLIIGDRTATLAELQAGIMRGLNYTDKPKRAKELGEWSEIRAKRVDDWEINISQAEAEIEKLEAKRLETTTTPAELDNIEINLDKYEKLIDDYEYLIDEEKKAGWIDAIELELIPLSDKRKDRLYNRGAKKQARKQRKLDRKANRTKRKEGKQKIEDIFNKVTEYDKSIANKEVAIDTLLYEMEKAKDDTVKFDSLQGKVTVIENEISTVERKIKELEDQAVVIAGTDKPLLRKLDREGRQATRRDKRNTKKLRKDNLIKLYGRGSAYRNAKKTVMNDIKDEKKADIQKYGGSFMTRMAKYLPATVATRNAFLGLLKLNFANISARIGKSKDKDPEKYANVIKLWKQLGGNEDNLNKAVDLGKGKKPIIGKNGKYEAIGEFFYPTGAEEGTLLTWVAVASPVIIAVIDALGGKDKDTGELPIPPAGTTPLLPLPPTCVDNGDGTCTMPDNTKVDMKTGLPYSEDSGSEDSGSFWDNYKWYIIGFGGLAVLGTTALLIFSPTKK